MSALTSESGSRHRWVDLRSTGARNATLLAPLILMVLIGSLTSDVFLTRSNLVNVLQQSSVLGIMVVAETIVLICGRFDLSIESIFGFAPMLAGVLMVGPKSLSHGIDPYLGIAVVLVLGALLGAVNGALIGYYRLNAFIVTLAMLILVRGVTEGMVNGQTVYSLPGAFTYLGSAEWGGIPATVVVWLVVAVGAAVLLRRFRLGRAIYAVGGNQQAARAAGINTRAVIFGAFVAAGILAAFAGMLEAGRIASITSTHGQNLIFYVMAAAVLGGISLNGGVGSLGNAMTGVLLLGLLQNILALSQVPSFWINATYGGVILASLVLTRLAGGEPSD